MAQPWGLRPSPCRAGQQGGLGGLGRAAFSRTPPPGSSLCCWLGGCGVAGWRELPPSWHHVLLILNVLGEAVRGCPGLFRGWWGAPAPCEGLGGWVPAPETWNPCLGFPTGWLNDKPKGTPCHSGTESPGAQGHHGVGMGHRSPLRAGYSRGLSHLGVFPAWVTPWGPPLEVPGGDVVLGAPGWHQMAPSPCQWMTPRGHPRRNSAPRRCRRVPCLQHRSPEQAGPGVPKVPETPEEQHRGVQGACRAVHPQPGAELRVLRACARSPPACSVPAHACTCTQLACTLVCTLVGCF